MKPHLWLIRFIGLIVPRQLRADWRQEWEAELRYRELLLAEWDRLDRRNKLELLRRSLSAFWDALCLQPERLEDEMYQDLRFGIRMLLKSKGFTAVAALTLALGIGANTAVFTLINALLLRALPVANPHDLVVISARGQGTPSIISFPMYRDLRASQNVFTDILASAGENIVRLSIPGKTGTVEVDNVRTGLVTANYWNLLGVQPALGRFFTEDEDRIPNSSETAGSLAVLSYSFWERQFGRDPGVIGRTVLVDRSPCRVIGVAPRGFFGERVGSEPDLWAPIISFSPAGNLENRRGQWTSEMGRLKPGISREQAQTAMTHLFQQLVQAERAQVPPENPNRAPAIRDYVIQLDPGATGLGFGRLRQTFTQPLWIIMAIVAVALLIACANVANLLLARAMARQHEISVRLALGCGRFRLIRQLLTESLLLSAFGAVAGMLVAWLGSRVLLRMVDTGPVALRLDLSPDARVLLFTAIVMTVTGIGFGLAPAWRASGFDLASAMKERARGAGQRVRQYLGRTLVVVQVALSLLLLIGAGLLIRSLYNLRQIDLGFRPEQVLLFHLAHNPSNREPAALTRVAREVHERVRQIPGVESASVSWLMLFGGSDLYAPLNIHDYTPASDENVRARFNCVSTGYFETVGMTLLAGRGIEERDAENAPHAAVINEAMARRYFPGAHPVGKTMEIAAGPTRRPIEIVGVVRDAKYNNLRAETTPMFYISIQQLPRTLGTLEVRTREPIAALSGPIRNALLGVTKDVMIRRVVTLQSQVDQTLAGERLITTLCAFFGALALLLASSGLYGVLSYAVAQRTQEIGIRMALGATGRNVLWLVLRQSLTVVLAGIVTGIPLAWLSARMLGSYLYGLSPTDPAAITIATLLLILVALLACYLPARRATQIDPMVAIRHE
ncbi:MAG TPA: ABC transporter permease [Blastocatellia bacterium]|nr:ABC transporter permease [Blastocatellia bacterium]